MNTIIRPRHFGLAPAPRPSAPHPEERRSRVSKDHRGTLLTPLVILCAWATMIGFYHIISFVGAALGSLVAP